MNPQLVNEMCCAGGLDAYRETVESVLNLISNSGCSVSTRYDVKYSNFEHRSDGGHIRVSLVNKDKPLQIIWKLLHEYGHFLSGPQKPTDSTMDREELAWKYADDLVRLFPALLEEISDYYQCREECLASYRKSNSPCAYH